MRIYIRDKFGCFSKVNLKKKLYIYFTLNEYKYKIYLNNIVNIKTLKKIEYDLRRQYINERVKINLKKIKPYKKVERKRIKEKVIKEYKPKQRKDRLIKEYFFKVNPDKQYLYDLLVNTDIDVFDDAKKFKKVFVYYVLKITTGLIGRPSMEQKQTIKGHFEYYNVLFNKIPHWLVVYQNIYKIIMNIIKDRIIDMGLRVSGLKYNPNAGAPCIFELYLKITGIYGNYLKFYTKKMQKIIKEVKKHREENIIKKINYYSEALLYDENLSKRQRKKFKQELKKLYKEYKIL